MSDSEGTALAIGIAVFIPIIYFVSDVPMHWSMGILWALSLLGVYDWLRKRPWRKK